MPSFANPRNKSAQQALAREIKPSLHGYIPEIAGWVSGIAYAVAAYLLACATDNGWLSLGTALFGLFSCWFVGAYIGIKTDEALKKRDERKAALHRKKGQIVDISRESALAWQSAVSELEIPFRYDIAKLENHYGLLLEIQVFDAAINDASATDKERLLARIKEMCTDELSVSATKLQIATSEGDRINTLKADDHHRYVNDLLGEWPSKQLED